MAKLYVKKSDGTYVPQKLQSVTNIDVVQEKGDSQIKVMSQKAVTDAMNASEEKLSELAHKGEVRHIERDLGMYPELEPVPLNSEVTGKYINSDGKYVDASGWNVASIGTVSLGNTYLLNMVSSANMVLGVALFVSRVYKRDKEDKIIGTTLTPLFSAKNTSIPASGYVLFEAMDDYDEVLVCYKPSLATQMLVARWGFKASHATQLRNLRLIVDNKTDFEGIYELLTAGYALNLVGKGNGEPQAFMSRKTGGGNITDGSAVIKEVDGVKPIVWNQLVQDGNTELSNNTADPREDSGIFFRVGSNASIIGGTTLLGLFTAIVVVNTSGSAEIYISGSQTNVNLFSVNNIIAGHKYLVSFDVTANDVTTVGGYKHKNRKCFDLTQMFGAGNEPSTYEEYLDRISHYHIEDAYAYNVGEIVNYRGTSIKTTGRNIWDEEWEVGSLDGSNGKPSLNGTIFRSKNYCPIFGNTEYYLASTSFPINIFFYDKDKNFMAGKTIYGQNKTFITPENAAFFKVRTDSPNNTYNHDICINLSDPAFNGQYEPYKSYVRDWSDAMKKYFPDGMTSLNGVKDFFSERKAVRKWGVKVFDGAENVAYVDTSVQNNKTCITYFDNERIIFKDRTSNVSTHICNEYSFLGNVGSKVIALQANVVGTYGYADPRNAHYYMYFVVNGIYTVTTWKQHLADLYAAGTPLVVYYELSEPVEDIFEKPLNLTYTVINGGTETSLATENSTQFEGSIAYNKDYVAVVDELQMQNRVTTIEFENWEK